MKRFCALAALLSLPLGTPNSNIQITTSTGALEPTVLYWPTKQGDARQRTGLLYTSELLANLIAGQAPETVPRCSNRRPSSSCGP